MSEIVKKEVEKLQLAVEQVTRTKSVFNQNQIQLLYQKTPLRFIYKRPAKGGGEWSFVKKSYMKKKMDALFGYNWDYIAETSVSEAFDVGSKTGSITVKGYIVGRVLDDKGNVTAEIKRGDFGTKEIMFKKDTTIPLNFGNDLKAANTDCLKRCASQLGIAADIYDAGEFLEIEILGSDESNERAKATKKRLESMKKELKAEEVK